MSASNTRIKDYDTVHHLVSRIAHKVFFLGDDERNDLIEVVRRAAAFGGLRLIGWCIMTNHFHLLVHLPVREEVPEDEVLRRLAILKGESGRAAAEMQLGQWKAQCDTESVKAWFDRQRSRMYDVGEFMKIVKQWFTEEYNRRNSHVGTLWESVYHDHVLPLRVKDMSMVLGYIHLNPVRAAACVGYSEYEWSSFSAVAKGDPVAVAGLRFAYGDDESSVGELVARHSALLDDLLEGIKRQHAQEVAFKRAAGCRMPHDPLTDEALVAQAAAHRKKIQDAVLELQIEDTRDRESRRQDARQQVLLAIASNPTASVSALANMLGMTSPTLYRHLRELQKRGNLLRLSRTSPWIVKLDK